MEAKIGFVWIGGKPPKKNESKGFIWLYNH